MRAALALCCAALVPGAALALEEAACRVRNLPYEVRCGHVGQPVGPDAGAPRIEVHYVRVPARARIPTPDPVYFIAGGPGQSATHVAAAVTGALARLNNRRDIVFVDLRGTGRSAALDCPGEDALTLAQRLDESAMREHTSACRTRYAGLPLQFYGTVGAAADIEAVRAALGHERINLVASSYGSRLALAYQALHAARVRSAVLDGVLPPDHDLAGGSAGNAARAWRDLVDACVPDRACAELAPDATLRGLIAAGDRSVDVVNPLTGAVETARIGPKAMVALVRAALHSPSAASALPAALDRAAGGRIEPLLALASSVWNARRSDGFSRGAHLAAVCNDRPATIVPPDADDPVFAPHVGGRDGVQCEGWRRPAAPPLPAVAPATMPVLLLSGGLDPVTPPALAQRVADALGPKARHLVSPGGGHGLLAAGCTRDLVYRFIDAGLVGLDAAPGSDCLTRVPRPPFLKTAGGAR